MNQQFWNGKEKFRWFWVFIPTALMTCYLYFRYQPMMQAPDAHLFTLGFDGIKNYFTTAWHLKHDLTSLGYQGMNHPYGEHVLFTDNQPILVNTARWVSTLFPQIKERGIGLVNLFQIFSLVFSVYCFVLLFRRLNLPGWYGALASFLLTLLSPQYLRFDGHFGLSHTWVIPLVLLMLHTYESKTYRRRISFKVGLFITFVSQLHMYYFGLFFLYLSIYHLLSFLRDPSGTPFYKRFVHWALMLLVPFGVLQFWLKASHASPDRSANPYGFHYYKGYWEGIFLPYPEWPLYQWIHQHITPITTIDGEASAYVGAFATVFFVLVVFTGFRVFRAQKSAPYGDRLNRNYLRNIWWAGVILALFACGYPHEIRGLEWMSDYYGPIRQFRSMGRFNWILFPVFNLTAFYWLWYFAETRKQLWQKVLACSIPFCLLAYEAYEMQRREYTPIQNNLLTRADPQSTPLTWQSLVDTSRHQAILPLPYYHFGSENLGLEPKYDLFLLTQRTAYATGVPDMGVNMSRTSLGQTIRQAQLQLEQVEAPRILFDLVSDKSILLFTLPHYESEVYQRSKHLLLKAKSIHRDAHGLLWELPLDSLKQAIRQLIEQEKAVIQSKVNNLGSWKTDGARFFRHENYNGLKTVNAPFIGSGAIGALQSDTTTLYTGGMPAGKYILSFWLESTTDQAVNAHIYIQVKNKSGAAPANLLESCKHHIKSIKDGWSLVEIPFDVQAEDGPVEVHIFQYKKGVKLPLVIDECQIRPLGVDVYFNAEHYLSKNNRWYED